LIAGTPPPLWGVFFVGCFPDQEVWFLLLFRCFNFFFQFSDFFLQYFFWFFIRFFTSHYLSMRFNANFAAEFARISGWAGSTWNFCEIFFWRESVWTLADFEWRAVAAGLKPLRLPRAPHSSWSGNIVNRKPPRGGRFLSIKVTKTLE